MLREPNLNLDKALQLGNSAEQTKTHVKELRQEKHEAELMIETVTLTTVNIVGRHTKEGRAQPMVKNVESVTT